MTKPISRKMAVDCLLYRINSVYHGLGCSLCHGWLMPGEDIQFDHIHADVFDGPHEYQNLRPVHAVCHKAKTKRDIAANAKVKRIIADKPSRHPMKSSGRPIPSRPFQPRRKRCEGCETNWADPPSKLCPGCQAYREHQA